MSAPIDPSPAESAVRHALPLAILAMLAVPVPSALAQDRADRVIVSALTQQGELLLKKQTALEPLIESLAREEQRLAAEEVVLLAGAESIKQTLAKYNAAVEEVNEAIKRHQAECAQTQDRELLQPCNAVVAELRSKGAVLEADGLKLDQRQKEVNDRITRYNAARDELNQRTQQNAAQIEPLRRDMDRWLVKMSEFLHSESFAAFANKAGSLPVCSDERVSGSSAASPATALKHALDCLRLLGKI